MVGCGCPKEHHLGRRFKNHRSGHRVRLSNRQAFGSVEWREHTGGRMRVASQQWSDPFLAVPRGRIAAPTLRVPLNHGTVDGRSGWLFCSLKRCSITRKGTVSDRRVCVGTESGGRGPAAPEHTLPFATVCPDSLASRGWQSPKCPPTVGDRR